MFRCTSAPIIKSFPTSLSNWGFTLHPNGELLDSNGQYFNYFDTDNERFNDLRHEAFQELVRQQIVEELRLKHDIHELFLAGSTGAKLVKERPRERHVNILSTEPRQLKRKRDVIVVVGETSQDLGIWAWRFVQREGGLRRGSVIGMVEKLRELGEGKRDHVRDEEGEEVDEKMKMKRLRIEKNEDKIPGLIVLSPGQLLYSPQLNKNLSLTSWNQRPRETLLSDPYDISPHHNLVPGHQDPHHHLHLTLESILQQLLSPSSPPRLHILAIGSGSIPLLDSLDQILLNKHELQVRGGNLDSIAMICPQVDPEEIMSEKLKGWLERRGKAWVQGEEERGSCVDWPEGMKGRIEYAEGKRVSEAAPSILVHGAPDPNDTDNKPDEEQIDRKDSLMPATDTADPTKALAPLDDEIPPSPRDPVACPTFSAGIADGVVETVFPEVIDDVLAHFFEAIEAGREKDAREGIPTPRDYYG